MRQSEHLENCMDKQKNTDIANTDIRQKNGRESDQEKVIPKSVSDEDILAARKKGYTICEIVDLLGCSRKHVSELIAANPIIDAEYRDNRFALFRGRDREEAIRKCVSMYKSGMRMRDIAVETGIPFWEVSDILQKAGLSPTGRHKKAGITGDEDRDAKIVMLRRQKMSYATIASNLNLCVSTVKKVCTRKAVNKIPCEPPNVVDREKLIGLYQSGMTPAQVADACGCTITSIYRILKSNGFPSQHEEKRKRDAAIREDFAYGADVKDLAAKYRVSWRTIYRIVHQDAGKKR